MDTGAIIADNLASRIPLPYSLKAQNAAQGCVLPYPNEDPTHASYRLGRVSA